MQIARLCVWAVQQEEKVEVFWVRAKSFGGLAKRPKKKVGRSVKQSISQSVNHLVGSPANSPGVSGIPSVSLSHVDSTALSRVATGRMTFLCPTLRHSREDKSDGGPASTSLLPTDASVLTLPSGAGQCRRPVTKYS